MEAYRIVLTSWTASFRCPNIISGTQLSLEAPPISTIYGLLSAAAGRYVVPEESGIAYCYRHIGQAFDLETIYKVELNGKGRPSRKPTADIVRRQVFFDNILILYIDNYEIAKTFKTPAFPLLLGRSGDLASVERIDKVILRKKMGLNIAGTVFPLKKGKAYGQLQALPTYFSNTIPRKNIDTQPFYIIKSRGRWKREPVDYLNFEDWTWESEPVFVDMEGYHDEATGLDLWWFGGKGDTC